jgi:hypothetical protein
VIAHEALSRLARERAAADAEEGRWFLAALRSGTHVHLGFGSFAEYVERLFGYKPRSTQEKLRVAEALEQLPSTARALERGALSWSAARELTRVAVAETEHEWLGAAQGKTIRQLEELVNGKRLGELPTAPADPAARRHVLRFEVNGETYALFREAVKALRQRSSTTLDDDAVLLELARQVLGGPNDDGRASYQVALDVCGVCRRATQQGAGTSVAVGPEVLAMASCDAQRLGVLHVANENDARAGTKEHHAHVGAIRSASDESGGWVDSNSGATVKPAARATQTIPPAIRRAVIRRDHGCCRVPGCRNATFLDIHHVELRAEGGVHDIQNLITLCGSHHRACHRGQLVLEGHLSEGGLSEGIRFRHADGSEYGTATQPRQTDAFAKTFSALRHLGFREKEIQTALASLRIRAELREASVELLLREALAELTAPWSTA